MNEPRITEKAWTKELEPLTLAQWKQDNVYAYNKKSKKPIYCIDTPPPYVNSPIHIGHATTYTLMDMFARYKRMRGYEVVFPLGLDRNGLPIEMAAEKKFNVKMTTLSREQALDYCQKILQESSMASVDSFYKLGISFNSWEQGADIGDVYHTDSAEYRTLTQDTFIDLWKKGLVYEGERVNNYCPGCQTTIADAEVDYADKTGNFHDLIFTVKETGAQIIIGTTRPELVGACAMVIFNPEDARYQHLDGKTAISPIYQKEIPIKAHPQAAIDKGTGLVMMCSYGDLADIRFFREQNLEPTILIEQDGKLNAKAGMLKGLYVKEARKKIVEELQTQKLLVKVTPTQQRTPICERSKDAIEFVSMKEFYLKQVEFKEELRALANKITFYDAASKQILLDWIESVSIDWPLSRRRYYATEIPLWKIQETGEYITPEKGHYYQPWKDKAPEALQKKHAGQTLIGETRVFDTWFDSATTPLYIMKYGTEFYLRNKPCALRPQGKEIVRTWLYYTLLKTWLLTGEQAFEDVWIHYHVVDTSGIKMSKSLGNIIDPQVILQKYGAEPFRLWCASEGNITTTDLRCSFDRIEGAGKTLTKLWNVARLISMFNDAQKPEHLEKLDEWILFELDLLVALSRKHYDAYDFNTPATRIKNFLWETYASHYLELIKKRAYNEDGAFSKEQQQSALYTLHHSFNILLKLLAPINPIITSRLYSELRNKNIHDESFPEQEKHETPTFTKQQLEELNSMIWKTKKDNGKSLRDGMSEACIPEHFKAIEHDLKLTHGIEKISYGKDIVLTL